MSSLCHFTFCGHCSTTGGLGNADLSMVGIWEQRKRHPRERMVNVRTVQGAGLFPAWGTKYPLCCRTMVTLRGDIAY